MHQWEAATQVWEMALRYDLWRRHPLGTQFQLESVGDGGQHPTLRGLSSRYNHVKHSVCKWNARLHQLRLKFEWQGVCAVRLGTASLVESQIERERSNFHHAVSVVSVYLAAYHHSSSFERTHWSHLLRECISCYGWGMTGKIQQDSLELWQPKHPSKCKLNIPLDEFEYSKHSQKHELSWTVKMNTPKSGLQK